MMISLTTTKMTETMMKSEEIIENNEFIQTRYSCMNFNIYQNR